MSLEEGYSAAYLPPEEQRADAGVRPGDGWLIYSGIVLTIAGVVGAIYGLAAISSSESFEQGAHYMTGDLETWGWVVLVVGVAQVAVGFGIWSGARWARLAGVLAAVVNSIVQLMWLPAQPLAALALFALDLLVIYGLVRYGTQRMGEPS
jgi:hypothetical protein